MDREEWERLTSPPPPVPPFWQYLLEKNYWVYYNVPMSLFGLTAFIFFIQVWWSWIAALLFGILFGASMANAGGSWSLWQSKKRLEAEDRAWVEKLSTGPRPFPRPIAQAMQNFVTEGKVGAAAQLALEYIKMADPEARRWAEEFDALPEKEKKKRRAEALRAMEEDS